MEMPVDLISFMVLMPEGFTPSNLSAKGYKGPGSK